ncbi:MAG: hypothetical protein N2595_04635, partial [bacterium]|nr:hypothetical protein [bacterium]
MKLRYCLLLCGFLPFPPPRALASPPVQVAARVELQHGAIRIAARNQLAETLPITMRIFSADGAHLPVSSFGLLLPPHGASSHLLPVRNVTLDQPVLHSLLVYARTNLVSLRLPCRSGALFRVATAGYLETSIPRRTTVSLQSTPGGPLQL